MSQASPRRPVVVALGGVGGPHEHSEICRTACEAGVAVLREGGSALDAAIAATVVLENDPHLNAGTGSNFRLDGRTIQMDAAVMDHDLRVGAVAAIEKVRNPVLVARRVMDTPHVLLAGQGATAFARAMGFPEYDPVSERARRRYAEVRAYFARPRDPQLWPAWQHADPDSFWNFTVAMDATLKKAAGPSDTVGAVARDARGRCAAALSTGGTSVMLYGRVGDTPIVGAGLYAGPQGAVAVTGDGEEIMRRVLAKTVYDQIAAGVSVPEALRRGVESIPTTFDVGLIGVSAEEEGAADNRTQPWALRYLE